MTGPNDSKGDGSAELEDELTPEQLAELEEASPLGAVLKRSLAADDAIAEPELLASVQRKLRKRSKGKFYGDGWSTTHSRINYALVAAVMLVTIVAVYLALGPTGLTSR